MRKIIFLSFLFLFVLLSSHSFADILYLENGSTVKGTLVKEDAKQVVFMVGGEGGIEVTFFKDEIIRIDKEDSDGTVALKFGEGKEVNVPLPNLIDKKPLITEQAGIQAESMRQQSSADITGSFTNMDDINEELMPLLSKSEIDYFMRFTEITKKSAGRMSTSVMNIGAISSDPDKLIGLVKSSMIELEKVINQLKQLNVPMTFNDFHSKYLSSLESLRNIYIKMQNGQIANLQSEVDAAMQNSKVLKEELEKILTLKKLTKTE